MYDDILKEKENLSIKLVQAEEERKRLVKDNDLLDRKMNDNAKVCVAGSVSPSPSPSPPPIERRVAIISIIVSCPALPFTAVPLDRMAMCF